MLDGFNPVITLEVALSGSLLLAGMDGTIRNPAGLRGSYRIVDKTVRAVELLLDRLEALGVRDALFYLDQQVSNSGRYCWTRRRAAPSGSGWSCTPAWTACSPGWRTWSPPTPSFWIKAAAGTT